MYMYVDLLHWYKYCETDGEFGNDNVEYRNEDADMVYTTDRLNPTFRKSLEVSVDVYY